MPSQVEKYSKETQKQMEKSMSLVNRVEEKLLRQELRIHDFQALAQHMEKICDLICVLQGGSNVETLKCSLNTGIELSTKYDQFKIQLTQLWETCGIRMEGRFSSCFIFLI